MKNIFKENNRFISFTFVVMFILIFSVNCSYGQTEKDISAINDIGLLYYTSGNYKEAITEFKKILRIKPDHEVAHYNIACVYEKMKQYKLALSEFQMVLNSIPNDSESQNKINNIAKLWLTNLKMDLESGNGKIYKIKSDMGLCYLYLGDLDNAYECLSSSIKIKDNYAESYYNLSKYYLRKGSYKQALEPAKKAFKLDPKNIFYSKNYQKIAQFLGVKSTIKSSRTVPVKSNNVENLFKKGKKQYDAEHYDAASKYFQRILKISPKNKLAKEYLNKIKEYRKKSGNIQDIYHSGEKYYKKELWSRAIDEFNKIIKIDVHKSSPVYTETLKMLSESYIRINKLTKAEDYLRELLRENPNDYVVNYNMGLVYDKMGKIDKAKKYFKLAKDSSDIPDKYSILIDNKLKRYNWNSISIYVYGLVGLALSIVIGIAIYFMLPSTRKKRLLQKIEENSRRSKFKEILEDYEKASDLPFNGDEFVRAYNIFAKAYLNVDNPDKAIMMAKRVIMKSPQNSLAHEILGKSFFRKKVVTTEALIEYKKLLEKDKGNIEILKLIGSHYLKNNKSGKLAGNDSIPDSLLENFKNYLSKDDSDSELLLYIANVLRKRKDTSASAGKIYKLALKYEPDNYRMRELLAKSLFEQKKYEKAIEESLLVFKENIGSTQIHRIFIDSYMALNRFNDVVLEYEKMSLAYPDNPDIERRLEELKKQNFSVEGSGKKEKVLSIDYGACFKKGVDFFNKGDINKAISELRVAKKDKKFKESSSIYLVKCYIKKELIDLAKEEFNLISSDKSFLSEELKEVIYDLAKILEKKGQFKDALHLYNRICKVDIGYRDVFDKFEELHDYVSKF